MESTKKKLYLMTGPAGSGKSSYVKKRLHERAEWISRDAIRLSLLREGEDLFKREDDVLNHFYRSIHKAINNKDIDEIYVDATHLTPKVRRQVLHRIPYWVEVTAVSLEVPLKVNYERNAQRSGYALVPEDTIFNMRNRFVIPTKNEGFAHIIHVNEKGEETYE